MKTYPKAIKTIICTSTTLCAAVGIAVTSAFVAVAVSAACLAFYLLTGPKIRRFGGEIYVKLLPIAFSTEAMGKMLMLKKAMSAEDTYK